MALAGACAEGEAEVVLVEVKSSRAASKAAFELSANELEMAQRLRDRCAPGCRGREVQLRRGAMWLTARMIQFPVELP